MPNPFVGDIMALARENDNYRQELVTANFAQVVLMSIPAGGEVGEEVHEDTDQVLLFTEGTGKAVLSDVSNDISMGSLVVVPMGTKHNFINTGSGDLKIVSVYAPPHHPVGTIHKTIADAQAAEAAEHKA